MDSTDSNVRKLAREPHYATKGDSGSCTSDSFDAKVRRCGLPLKRGTVTDSILLS